MIKLRSKILEELSEKRNQAERDQKKRRLEVYSKIPKLLDIDNQMADLSLEVTKKILDLQKTEPSESQGIQSDMIETLRQQIEYLKTSKAFLLTENNIPLDYLDIKYECEHCQDTGILKDRTHCSCFKQKLSDYLYAMSNISKAMEIENFSTFDIGLFSSEQFEGYELTPRQNMVDILTKSKAFVDGFQSKNKNRPAENLLFFGSTGQGKTFLCNSIAKELISKGHTVVYQTSYKIIETLERIRFRSSRLESFTNENLQYELINECDLLIIDDLGTELVNSFTNSELFNIINSRMLSNKSVIISTNLSPQQLMDTYSDRISSRIFGNFDIIKFYGPDLRWEKKSRI